MSYGRHLSALESERQRVLADLREFVQALDRRVPRPEREGEDAIVRDAAAMRRDAQERIEQLQPPSPAQSETP